MNLAGERTRIYFGRKFDELLKEWKSQNRKTQKDFCAAAGVSKNIVTAWKRGKAFPRDAQMQKICDVLGIDQRAFEPCFPLERDNERRTTMNEKHLAVIMQVIRAQLRSYLSDALANEVADSIEQSIDDELNSIEGDTSC